MGDREPGRPADDLVFVVAEKPHPRFTREGNDLYTSVTISLLQAVEGGSTQVRPATGSLTKITQQASHSSAEHRTCRQVA
jgi:DnaJ family protein B protein 4